MSDTPTPETPAKKKLQSPLVLWSIAIVAGVGIYFGLVYLVEVFTHESTDDAFIAGHVISLAPRVAGQVTDVKVLDNQLVNSNELLVAIDPADYDIALAQKQATADAQEASYRTMIAAGELMRLKVTTAGAAVRKAKADEAAAEATAVRAKADFVRATELRHQNTISQSEFDAAKAASTQAEADWKSAIENSAETVAKVDEANQSLAAALAQTATVQAQWREAQTNTAQARLNLTYTKIVAPAAGRITRKAVETGDYVQTGQQLLSIVPTEVWVVANFKESQLKNMRPGQSVSVAIDALGGRNFAAHVDSIQAGSGAQFSLLPPENATGNFVKVIQRVPVKIVFDEPLPADKVIGPGLSVTPDVQTSNFVMPAWALALIAGIIAGPSALGFLFLGNRKTAAK